MRVREFEQLVKNWAYLIFLLGTLVALIASAFSWKPAFNKLKLEGKLRFVDSTVILQILGNVDSIKPYNLEKIEIKLEALEPVKEAHLFISHDSVLVIRVKEHVPIARIITLDGEDYYMAEDGTIFPITEVSKPVYVITVILPDNFNAFSEKVNDLRKLVKTINNQEFIASMSAHLTYSLSDGWVLISRVDKQKIIIGDVDERLDKKLNKLRRFYKFVKKHGLWQTYKTIDLRYEDQLVASK